MTAGQPAGAGRFQPPFVSIGVRAVINVEALNMVETAGNVARHRTVPVVVQSGPGRYLVRWVPAISGESLAHRYQRALVELARADQGCRDRLDYWSEREEFLKHFDLGFYSQLKVPLKQWEQQLAGKYVGKSKMTWQEAEEVERMVVANSVVEDVGGFLVTQGPVKRTSRVQFSFAVPTVDSIEAGAAQVDAQFQVRHAPQSGALAPSGATSPQMPYYVQIASAVYGFTVNLDLAGVGVLSYAGQPVADQACPPEKRRRLAVQALEPVLDLDFGAKRSRYHPHGQVELALAVVADRPVTVSPPTLRFEEFVRSTLERASKLGVKAVVAWTPKEDVEKALREKKVEQVVRSSVARDFVDALLKAAGL